MTDATEAPVIWTPSEKQAEFLACADYEVLYGGAAGGGKTDAMLIDGWCLPYGGPTNPNHRAVIFRKTYPDLKDIIDRSHDLFPRFIDGAKYNTNEHIWTAPSGAKFEFAYLQYDGDRFKYRGRAWNWIGWEELTLWSTPAPYDYLKSRNRTADPRLPRFIRSTTNPDGPGQKWVMERWGINERGDPTRILTPTMFEEQDERGEWTEVERVVARTFIPAKLVDNPHLRGSGYRETLREMPPDEREALLEGLWTGNRVKGAYYVKEMQKARAENRICRVPWATGVPVNTFWDLGWNDSTAVWFHQYQALENRFPLAYEASGETLAHYASFLQRVQNEHGIAYGTHYLPHDAENKSLQTGKSALDLLKEYLPGHRFVVVPRVEAVLIGIQQTRAVLGSCWFDREGCSDGVAALDAYRKRWNNRTETWTDQPEHDRFSNYADAFRQFGQGFKPAHRLVEKREEQERRRRRGGSGNANWRTV